MTITCLQCSKRHKACRNSQRFCGNKCAIDYRIKNGWRPNTEQAHQTIRERGQPKLIGKKAGWLKSEQAESIKKKISISKKGAKNPMYNRTGAKHHNWKGGAHKDLWHTVEYQRWRKAIFDRDSYACVQCGDNTGGNLEADHIKPRYLYPELALEVTNGRTLCKDCHRATPTWGAKVKRLVRV